MSVHSKMTAIANAVRAFFKWDDKIMLGLDAMAGYLGYVNQLIDNAFQSIENKGVTVPDDATVFDLSSLINSIPTGGGASIESCSVYLRFAEFKLVYYNYVVIGADGAMQPMSMVQHDYISKMDREFENVAAHSYVILILNQTENVHIAGEAEIQCSFDSDNLTILVIEVNGDCMIYDS